MVVVLNDAVGAIMVEEYRQNQASSGDNCVMDS